VEEKTVVPEHRKIPASRNFFGVLLLFNVVRRDPRSVIVFEGKFYCFFEIDLERLGWASLLSRRVELHDE
jgi:hypothetical protein